MFEDLDFEVYEKEAKRYVNGDLETLEGPDKQII